MRWTTGVATPSPGGAGAGAGSAPAAAARDSRAIPAAPGPSRSGCGTPAGNASHPVSTNGSPCASAPAAPRWRRPRIASCPAAPPPRAARDASGSAAGRCRSATRQQLALRLARAMRAALRHVVDGPAVPVVAARRTLRGVAEAEALGRDAHQRRRREAAGELARIGTDEPGRLARRAPQRQRAVRRLHHQPQRAVLRERHPLDRRAGHRERRGPLAQRQRLRARSAAGAGSSQPPPPGARSRGENASAPGSATGTTASSSSPDAPKMRTSPAPRSLTATRCRRAATATPSIRSGRQGMGTNAWQHGGDSSHGSGVTPHGRRSSRDGDGRDEVPGALAAAGRQARGRQVRKQHPTDRLRPAKAAPAPGRLATSSSPSSPVESKTSQPTIPSSRRKVGRLGHAAHAVRPPPTGTTSWACRPEAARSAAAGSPRRPARARRR